MGFLLKTKIVVLCLLMVASCASRKDLSQPVLLKFVGGDNLGLVVYPIDWMRPADQDNPGVDCTLRLEKQGPPQNVYTCLVRDGQNVYIVKLYEGFAIDPEDRRLARLTVDSKWAVTRDMWIEDLRKAGFREAATNPKGSLGEKWVFISLDRVTQVSIFWNDKTQAVSALVAPLAENVKTPR